MDYLGKAKFIKLKIKSNIAEIEEIALNRQVPFFFNIIRWIVLIMLCLIIYSLKRHSFWEECYSKTNIKQNIVVGFIILLGIFTIYFYNIHCCQTKLIDFYDMRFIDALKKGQTYLQKEPDADLLSLENPYDPILRHRKKVNYIWDTSLYDGKYYVYFGTLPAISIMLPYNLITRQYIGTNQVVLLFSVLSIIALGILTLEILKKYFPELKFKYSAISILIMMFSTMIIWLNIAPRFYELVSVSGLFFAIVGVLLIIISEKDGKTSYVKILGGTLCLALAVACRPTQLLTSLVAIPFLWKVLKNNIKKEKKEVVKLILCVAIPYLIIGGLLMYYNYIRFGNILDFGTKYQLTVNDMLHLRMSLFRIPTGLLCDLFNLPVFTPEFPFIQGNSNIINNFMYYYCEDIPAGVFILSPIAFMCFGIFNFYKKSENKELKNFVVSLILTGLLLVIVTSVKAGSTGRYFLDFAWMFVLAGILIFMTKIQNYKTEEGKTILTNILYIILCFTLVINLLSGFCSIGGKFSIKKDSPKMFFDTEYSIMFMK